MKTVKLILIVLLFVNTGCTFFQLSKEEKARIRVYKDIKKQYDNWELDEVRLQSEKYLERYGKDREIEGLRDDLPRKERMKKELNYVLGEIKQSLKNNDIESVKKYVDKTLVNVLKLKEFEKVDFSMVEVHFGKIKYHKEAAEVLMLASYGEEAFYYEIDFKLNKDKWKISTVNERR